MKLSRNFTLGLALRNLRTARISRSYLRWFVPSVATAKPKYSNLLTSTPAATIHGKLLQLEGPRRTCLRYNSTASTPPVLSTKTSTTASSVDYTASSDPEIAAYEITFTCKPCKHRSAHRISKQGYHKGTVLITCPECKNRHVISDHLKIFSDKSITIEDLMRDKGEYLQRGTLGADGDVEFWDDKTDTHAVG
ncbi:hypothetical protein MMC26_001033 [Xylographa opegraphella]|nr:hypothetical protein [Xylographa opegraphella]